MIRTIIGYFRERRARARLAEIVAQTRASFECERYRRNRAAQIKRRRT